jgi:hypothetical protein
MPHEGSEHSALGGADFFERARRFAAAGLVLAGLCAVTGSFLDWAVITEREVAEDIDFGVETGEIEPEQAEPFAGIEDRDGRLTLAGGIVLVVAAVLLLVQRRSGVAWFAFWVAVMIGGIAFADYRSVSPDDEAAPGGIAQRQELGGEAQPGPGLTIVAAGAMLGVISSVGAVAATPRDVTTS